MFSWSYPGSAQYHRTVTKLQVLISGFATNNVAPAAVTFTCPTASF